MISVYLPVNSTVREDTIRLFAMVGTGFVTYGTQTNTSVSGLILNYKWNIKIRQIDCKANDPFEGKKNRITSVKCGLVVQFQEGILNVQIDQEQQHSKIALVFLLYLVDLGSMSILPK